MALTRNSLTYSESTTEDSDDTIVPKFTKHSPRSVLHFDKYNHFLRPPGGIAVLGPYQDIHTTPRLPFLKKNLIKRHEQQDPAECYEVLKELGRGSMGRVVCVRKRLEASGGTAALLVKRKKEKINKNNSFETLKSCFWFCFLARNRQSHICQDVFQVISDHQNNDDQYLTQKHDTCGDHHSKISEYRPRDIVYAMKTSLFNHASSSAETSVREIENEVNILKDLDHPNIVRVIETFSHQKQPFILIECCAGGDLYSRDPYTEYDARNIVKSVLNATAYMHSKHIAHRDIKFENILYTSQDCINLDVKLVDFGLSKKCTMDNYLHTRVGTAYAMAPELLRGEYTRAVDMWSIGVITYMLLSSTMPFFGRSRKEMFQKILKGDYCFFSRRWKYISRDAQKFVSALLETDVQLRVTAEKALMDPWLKNKTIYGYDCIEKAKCDIVMEMDRVMASMQNFAEYAALKKLALMIVAFKSSIAELGILHHLFDEFVGCNFDSSIFHTGEITLANYKTTIMKEFLYCDEEMERMFDAVDIDGSGVIDYNEFLAAVIEVNGEISEERLAEAFDHLDCDNSGFISESDLKKFLGCSVIKKDNNLEVPTAYIEQIIDEVDFDHDGMISYEDFFAMWNNHPSANRSSYHLHLTQVKQRRMRWVVTDVVDTQGVLALQHL